MTRLEKLFYDRSITKISDRTYRIPNIITNASTELTISDCGCKITAVTTLPYLDLSGPDGVAVKKIFTFPKVEVNCVNKILDKALNNNLDPISLLYQEIGSKTKQLKATL